MNQIGLLALVIMLLAAPTLAQKKVVLSYDDAPRGDGRVFTGPERAVALTEALASVNSGPVVFFVTTRGFDRHADGRQRIEHYASAGHLIANHSHGHTWAHRTEAAAYLADIDQAEDLLQGLQNRRSWFRYPYLDEGREPEKIKALAAGLEARGLVNGYVTIDNYDWHLERRLQDALKNGRAVDYEKLGRFYVRMLLYAAEYYDSLAVQTLGASPVHVLLLHENDLAALYADELVLAFREAGWEIASPDEAYDAPLPAPQTPWTGQGRVVGLARDAGRPGHTMWTWALDEGMIDLALERSGAFEGEGTQD